MPAKKIALSLCVVAASGAYVWGEAGRGPADDPAGPIAPVADAQASPAEPRAPPPAFASPSPTGVPAFTTEPIGTPSTAAAGVAVVARRDETAKAADDPPGEADDPLRESVSSEPAPAPAVTGPEPARAATELAPAAAVTEPAPVPADEAPVADPAKPVVVAEAGPAVESVKPQAVKASVRIPIPRPRPARHAQRTTAAPGRADAAPGPTVSAASSTGSISANNPALPPAAPAAADKRPGDGAFTGPAVDAYYGLVQVEAIVQNGQLVDVKVLQYPSHRRTSVSINRRALPMLHDEVIMAQNTKVDVVSGATLTSVAFMRSLTGALRHGGA